MNNPHMTILAARLTSPTSLNPSVNFVSPPMQTSHLQMSSQTFNCPSIWFHLPRQENYVADSDGMATSSGEGQGLSTSFKGKVQHKIIAYQLM